jgi:hypothetical protein
VARSRGQEPPYLVARHPHEVLLHRLRAYNVEPDTAVTPFGAFQLRYDFGGALFGRHTATLTAYGRL